MPDPTPEPNERTPFLLIAILGSVLMLVITAVATVPTYRAAPAFLIPLLWLGYALRRRLHLLPSHYALYASALLLHNLGAFGYYQKSPLPMSFDVAVHFYFPLVGAVIAQRAIALSFPFLTPWQVSAVTFFVIMGSGAVHEIIEYTSYLLLGEQRGMLKPSTSYFFDTQRDLTSNLVGAVVGLLIAAASGRAKDRQAAEAIWSPAHRHDQTNRAE